MQLFINYGFDNIIVDEADAFFADKSRNSLLVFPATRKFGFSGTIKTPYDEFTESKELVLAQFYGHLEEVPFDVDDTPLKEVYYTEYKKIYQGEVTDKNGDKKHGVILPNKWHSYREYLDEDMDRKKAMFEYISNNADNKKDFTLILFDRVEDVKVMYKVAKKRGLKAYMSYGTLKDRDTHMDEFKANGGYLFAQYKTVGRGWDFVKLNKLFVMFPIKLETTIRQIFGRVIREYGDKEAYIYLWADEQLNFQFRKQQPIIKKYFNKKLIKI